MKNLPCKVAVNGSAMLMLAMMLAGCGTCKPGKLGTYGIDVALDQSLKSSSVVVDLVGVNLSNLAAWENYDMGKYWRQGDARRRGEVDKVTYSFVSGQSVSNSLPAKDAKWAEWRARGVTHVAVLADLPNVPAPLPGNQDPRRHILSLDKCEWESAAKSLKVIVKQSGIDVVTPPRVH